MRTKKALINLLTDALPQIIILVLGFFKIKFFIKYLGNDNLGLYQLYGQIVSYLVLIEGGIGSAMLFRLYKPIHDKNQKKINQIMSAAKTIFNIVGIIILILGVIISLNLSFFIKDNSFSSSFLIFTFLLYLISQSLNYFVIPYRSMFDAAQDRYIPNIIYQTITIIKSIIEIIIVLTGKGLIEILISLVILSIISNVLIYIAFKKKYPKISFKEKKDFTMVKDVKHLFVNTIGNLVTNNIDVLLISKFIGLKTVVIYTTYNYFVEAIKQLIDKITGATMSGIGDVLSSEKKEDKDKAANIFREFNNLVFFLAMIICIPFFIFINKFIDIWYEGEIATKLIFGLLFMILLFLSIIRVPLKVFSLSSGKFKEVKHYVTLEIIINLALSLLLIKRMGIAGVLIGTIVSIIIAELIFKVRIIHKKIIYTKSFKYYVKLISNIFYLVLISLGLYFLIPNNYNSLITCIIWGIVVTIGNLLLTLLYFKITKQLNFLDRFQFLTKFISKRKEA